MENEIVNIPGGVAEVSMRNPSTVLAEMQMVADAIRKQADKLGLYKQIGPSKHLKVEGWQMIGHMYRVLPRVVETKFLDYGQVRGWEARAEAYHVPTGQVVSMGDSMCLSDEDNWGLRSKYEDNGEGKRVKTGMAPTPLFQLRSMAQTRACAKCLSNIFKPVATMGGFHGTPAEEMTGSEDGQQPAGNQPQRKGGSGLISEPQEKRIWALANQAGKSKEEVMKIVEFFGFKQTKDVTRDKYEAICTDIQRKSEPSTPHPAQNAPKQGGQGELIP